METSQKEETVKETISFTPEMNAITKPTSIIELVDQLIDSIKGFGAKYNHDKTLSVVDLANKGSQQGTTYRQLFVRANQGYMNVSIIEAFKSSHGGGEQGKTLFKFDVPISEAEAYLKLQVRFYSYSESDNLTNGFQVLDLIRKTVVT